jgi:hypothetical protein
VHRFGKEAKWWAHAGIDPMITARKLWLETHPILEMRDAKSAVGDDSRPASAAAPLANATRKKRNGKTNPSSLTTTQ